jgi:hypothetical protein
MTPHAGKKRELRELATSVALRLSGFLARRTGPGDPRRRRVVLVAAIALFVGGTILGVLNLPEVETEPRWELLAVVLFLGVPATLALNAAEYQVTAAIAGFRVPFVPALRVGVLATAANLLPLPGAVLVKAYALRNLGSSYGVIAKSTGAVAVCFLGTTGVMAGAVLLATGTLVAGGILTAAGVALLALALAMLVAECGARRGPRLFLAAVARVAGAIGVKAGRIYLILLALGYEAGATQALVLTLAAVLATALGFFPAGLGVAEALAAVMSPLVGLSAAVGFVASAVDRLISMVGLAVLAGGVLLFERRRDRAGSPPGEQQSPSASDTEPASALRGGPDSARR